MRRNNPRQLTRSRFVFGASYWTFMITSMLLHPSSPCFLSSGRVLHPLFWWSKYYHLDSCNFIRDILYKHRSKLLKPQIKLCSLPSFSVRTNGLVVYSVRVPFHLYSVLLCINDFAMELPSLTYSKSVQRTDMICRPCKMFLFTRLIIDSSNCILKQLLLSFNRWLCSVLRLVTKFICDFHLS